MTEIVGKFLDVCYDSHYGLNSEPMEGCPEIEVNFQDWTVYVSILVESGLVNLNDENVVDQIVAEGNDKGFYRFGLAYDDSEKITELDLTARGGVRSFDLPTSVRHLEHLETLGIYGPWKSLPWKELSSLSSLKDILIRSDVLSDIPETVKFQKLKSLTLEGTSTMQLLDRVEDLDTLNIEYEQSIDLLCSSEYSWAKNLKRMTINSTNSEMTGHHFEKILFEVLPRFPGMICLNIGFEFDFSSFKAIQDRIQSNNKPCVVSKSLQIINFQAGVEGLSRKTQAALLVFLKTFPAVRRINLSELSNECEYALIQNAAGRGIVQGWNHGSNKGGKKNGGKGNRNKFPLSAWPVIMQQLGRRYYDTPSEATGIYYLLREIPALIGQSGMNNAASPTKKYRSPLASPRKHKRSSEKKKKNEKKKKSKKRKKD